MLLLNGPTTEDERGKKSDLILCITNKWRVVMDAANPTFHPLDLCGLGNF